MYVKQFGKNNFYVHILYLKYLQPKRIDNVRCIKTTRRDKIYI